METTTFRSVQYCTTFKPVDVNRYTQSYGNGGVQMFWHRALIP